MTAETIRNENKQCKNEDLIVCNRDSGIKANVYIDDRQSQTKASKLNGISMERNHIWF